MLYTPILLYNIQHVKGWRDQFNPRSPGDRPEHLFYPKLLEHLFYPGLCERMFYV